MNRPFTLRLQTCLGGATQLGCASCLTSAGRVTLTGGISFVHINALACQTGTTLGMVSVTYNAQRFKINSAKPTVIEWPGVHVIQKMRNICKFDYSTKVMNNHAGTTLTMTMIMFSHCKPLITLPWGEGCHWYPRPFHGVLGPHVGYLRQNFRVF